MKLHAVLHGYSVCNWISVSLVLSEKDYQSSWAGHLLRISSILRSDGKSSLLQPPCSRHLRSVGDGSVKACLGGRGRRSQAGVAGAQEGRLVSSVVTAPLVPPVGYRKAHSFSLLNGGNLRETVKHAAVVPLGAKAAVQVSAEQATVGSIYFFALLVRTQF